MKKILILALGLFAFACGESANNRNTGTGNAATENANTSEDVEKGSGKEISPQLEPDSVTEDRFDVDTVSSETIKGQEH